MKSSILRYLSLSCTILRSDAFPLCCGCRGRVGTPNRPFSKPTSPLWTGYRDENCVHPKARRGGPGRYHLQVWDPFPCYFLHKGHVSEIALLSIECINGSRGISTNLNVIHSKRQRKYVSSFFRLQRRIRILIHLYVCIYMCILTHVRVKPCL